MTHSVILEPEQSTAETYLITLGFITAIGLIFL